MRSVLSRDSSYFQHAFPNAASFLVAAYLRHECYVLACDATRGARGTQRLKEILHAPACREQWFVVMLRNDARNEGIEEILIEAGL